MPHGNESFEQGWQRGAKKHSSSHDETPPFKNKLSQLPAGAFPCVVKVLIVFDLHSEKAEMKVSMFAVFILSAVTMFPMVSAFSGKPSARPKRHFGKRPSRHSKASKLKHVRGHSPLKVNPEFTVSNYKQLKERGSREDCAEYSFRFFEALRGGQSRSVAVSKFLSLLRREQAFEPEKSFNKDDVIAISKKIKEDGVRAIESSGELSRLLDTAISLFDEKVVDERE